MSVTSPGTTVPPPSGAPTGGAPNFFSSPTGTTLPPSSTPTSSTAATPPLISMDQGTLSQYYINQIGSNPVDVQGIPGLSAATTIGAALQDIYDMPPGQLQELQQMLMAGGFYKDAAGNPLNNLSSIQYGYADNQTWLALGRALAQASTTGQGLLTMLVNSGAAGAGVKQIQGAMPALTGGGHTYQVNLTSRASVYNQAMSTYQRYLGRDPTQEEVSALTAALNSQETYYQQTINAQQETAQKGLYQQAQNSRTAQYTPQGGTGPVPAGPFNTPSDYALAVLSAMNLPTTASNVAFLTTWIQANGGLNGPGQNNPFGVKTAAAGATPNKGGAQDYPTAAAGVQAVVNLLSAPQYTAIYGALASGDASHPTNATTLNSELSQWSGGSVKSLNVTKSSLNAATTAISTSNAAVAPPPPPTSSGIAMAPHVGQTGAPQAPPTSPGAQLSQPPTGPTTPPGQTGGGQGLTSPGDAYLPSTTTTNITPPSAADLATQSATTGANRPQYLGNLYDQFYQMMTQAISNAPAAKG